MINYGNIEWHDIHKSSFILMIVIIILVWR